MIDTHPSPPRPLGRRARIGTVLLTLLILSACGDSTTGPGAEGGTVTVSVTTWGSGSDADGYILIGGDPVSAPTNGQVSLRLAPGERTVGLRDVAGHCRAPEDQVVAVSETGSRTVAFEVECFGDFVYMEQAYGYREIRYLDAEGRTHNVTDDLPGMVVLPQWSPDGAWIAFELFDGVNGQVHRVRSDGSGMEKLTQGPGDRGYPMWSPGGRHLAYVTRHIDQGHLTSSLNVVDFDGEIEETLDQASGDVAGWSSAASIVYESGGEVREVDRASGTSRRILDVVGRFQKLSPDGAYLAFDRRGGLEVMDMASGSRWPLLPELSGVFDLEWSKDSEELLVFLRDTEARGLYSVNRDGTGLRMRVPGGTDNSYAWTADTEAILVTKVDGDDEAIVARFEDGSELTLLGESGVRFSWPVFRPGAVHQRP